MASPKSRTIFRKNGDMTEVGPSAFDQWERRAALLFQVMVQAARTPDAEFLQNNLRAVALQAIAGHPEGETTVDYLFPPR